MTTTSPTIDTIPAHVPAHLVFDFDRDNFFCDRGRQFFVLLALAFALTFRHET